MTDFNDFFESFKENPLNYYNPSIERLFTPEQKQLIKDERRKAYIKRNRRIEELYKMRNFPTEDIKNINPIDELKNLIPNSKSILIRYIDKYNEGNSNRISWKSRKNWKNLYIVKNNDGTLDIQIVDPKQYEYNVYYTSRFKYLVPYYSLKPFYFNTDLKSPLIKITDGSEQLKIIKLNGIQQLKKFLNNKIILEIHVAEVKKNEDFIRHKVIFTCLFKDCYSYKNIVSKIQKVYKKHRAIKAAKTIQKAYRQKKDFEWYMNPDNPEGYMKHISQSPRWNSFGDTFITKLAKSLKIKLSFKRNGKRYLKKITSLKKQIISKLKYLKK
jgi:hypothetical protein